MLLKCCLAPLDLMPGPSDRSSIGGDQHHAAVMRAKRRLGEALNMGVAQRDDALTSLFAELSCFQAAGFRAAGSAGVAVRARHKFIRGQKCRDVD